MINAAQRYYGCKPIINGKAVTLIVLLSSHADGTQSFVTLIIPSITLFRDPHTVVVCTPPALEAPDAGKRTAQGDFLFLLKTTFKVLTVQPFSTPVFHCRLKGAE